MPAADAILAGLTRTAHSAVWLAMAWHAVLGGGLLALLWGWRPSQRLAACLLAGLVLSAAVVALAVGNLFNAVLLGGGALSLLVLSPGLKPEPAEPCSPTGMVWAFFLLELGWLYPHFLSDGLSWRYLYAAPLGVLPCPTLAAAIGGALLARGFGARAWSTILACLGLFYGLFGTLRLSVAIDALLVVGALILLGNVWSREAARMTGARTVNAARS